METLTKYNKVFTDCFDIPENQLEGLKYQSIVQWDSIGHMQLMASLEEEFSLELDIDDIIDFSSYEKGKEILNKYNISFIDGE